MSLLLKYKQAVKGEQVTTVNQFGKLGIGYLVNRSVYRAGSGPWAVDVSFDDIVKTVSFIRDGGKSYTMALPVSSSL